MARNDPLTPEQFHKLGKEAEELGYPELAELFHNTADVFATWNEHHTRTVEEIRQRIGDDLFFAILRMSLDVE